MTDQEKELVEACKLGYIEMIYLADQVKYGFREGGSCDKAVKAMKKALDSYGVLRKK